LLFEILQENNPKTICRAQIVGVDQDEHFVEIRNLRSISLFEWPTAVLDMISGKHIAFVINHNFCYKFDIDDNSRTLTKLVMESCSIKSQSFYEKFGECRLLDTFVIRISEPCEEELIISYHQTIVDFIGVKR
jgi:hypothetical protein